MVPYIYFIISLWDVPFIFQNNTLFKTYKANPLFTQILNGALANMLTKSHQIHISQLCLAVIYELNQVKLVL